jgi:hypothetical protein
VYFVRINDGVDDDGSDDSSKDMDSSKDKGNNKDMEGNRDKGGRGNKGSGDGGKDNDDEKLRVENPVLFLAYRAASSTILMINTYIIHMPDLECWKLLRTWSVPNLPDMTSALFYYSTKEDQECNTIALAIVFYFFRGKGSIPQ